jgi:hypothetical protein
MVDLWTGLLNPHGCDFLYFGGYNCPDCLRYVKEGFGLFRWKRNGEIERYCWNCHQSMRIEEEE